MARGVLDIFEAVAARRMTAEEGARLLEERRGLVLRLGRLRIQIGGEGFYFEVAGLEERHNPRWRWVAQIGPVSLRWARQRKGGR